MTRSTKKFFIAILSFALVFVMAFGLAACGGSGEQQKGKQYTVTFVYNDDETENTSVRVEEGKSVAEPALPERSGYLFTGWFSDAGLTEKYNFESAVTKNTLLYAGWDQAVTVTLVYNDGATENAVEKISLGAVFGRPQDPVRAEYTFKGWFANEQLKTEYDFTAGVTENITLYAKWAPVVSVVTFVYNDGKTPDSETRVTTGEKLEKPADPTNEGYSFGGWYTDETLTKEYDFNEAVTDNMSLYALWLEEGADYHTVTLHYNDGTGSTSSTRIKDNGRVQKPADPERDGYEFMGWYSDEAMTQSFLFSTRITADTDVYVKWGVSYVFEAEDTYIADIVGKGYSGNATGSDIIGRGAGASNGYYVTYLYNTGITLEFQITSDKAVSDAILHLSLSAELAHFTITGETYQVLVNDVPMAYELTFDDFDTSQTAEKKLFEFYEISTSVSLNQGVNVIKLVTNNSIPLMGTMNATAPMVDAVKIITDVKLGWNTEKGYPFDNTSTLS